MIRRIGPRQFNFMTEWNAKIRNCREDSPINEEFAKILDYRHEIIEAKFEEGIHSDEEVRAAEYQLDLHTAQVKYKDLFWLKENFEGVDLSDLSYEIATELYPHKKWEILEAEEDAIVTDEERTLVFDIKNFDKLSGAASLLFVNDPKFYGGNDAIKEAMDFRKQQMGFEQEVLEKIEKTLEIIEREAVVLEFKKKP